VRPECWKVADPGSSTEASSSLSGFEQRRVPLGGLFWIVGTVQFVLAMAITQLAWTHPYSLATNDISDLGNMYCSFDSMEGVYVCSPWHVLFNVSVILFGIFLIIGVIALMPALPSQKSARLASALLCLAGVGAIVVGSFPSDVNPTVHIIGSLFAFLGFGIAMILLGRAMSVGGQWEGYRQYSIASGIVTLAAFVVFVASPTDGALGSGGVERIIVASFLLWLVVMGLHMTRARRETSPLTDQVPAVKG
jgi:hypothetical membrane protein